MPRTTKTSSKTLVLANPEIEKEISSIRRGKRGEKTNILNIEEEPLSPNLNITVSERTVTEQTNMAEEIPRNPLNQQNQNPNQNGVNGNNGINNEGHDENNGRNGNHRRGLTIKQLTQSDGNFEPMPGVLPEFDFDFEIKGQLIHSLPKFYGLADENPYLHLRSLYMKCLSMKPTGARIEDVMWKVFHLTLEGKAHDWYMHLHLYADNAYGSWTNLKKAFLDKYFPSTKISAARKEISSTTQELTETFF